MRKAGNTVQISALNSAACAAGLTPAMTQAEAQNLCPDLQILPHDTKADTRLLKRLGLWAMQFTPLVMLDAPHALALNIHGCGHLFGGEAALARQSQQALATMGFTAHAALADTLGAARALAHTAPQRPLLISGTDATAKALAPLPLARLGPDQAAVQALRTVGLRTIGDLHRAPRASLARRYGAELLKAYDQAHGRAPEAFTPLMPPARFRESRTCATPLISFEDLCEAARLLSAPLATRLERAACGALHLRLLLFRVDGRTVWFDVRCSTPAHDAALFTRLLHDRLRQFKDQIDAGFGFDRAALEAVDTTPFEATQTSTQNPAHAQAATINAPAITALADRLNARFGDGTAQRFYARASHWPERAARIGAYEHAAPDWQQHTGLRPLTLFTPPQAIDAVAELPDGPPARITWRRQNFIITHAAGPERLEPEWWLLPSAIRKAGPEAQRRFRARSYYRLEDESGHRFWVFARMQETGVPQWFIHGLFA